MTSANEKTRGGLKAVLTVGVLVAALSALACPALPGVGLRALLAA